MKVGSGATAGAGIAPSQFEYKGVTDGLRVAELALGGPAPMAGMILGDLGADVIRIERPGGTQRHHEERTLKLNGRSEDELSAEDERLRAIRPVDRNKRSLAIDLKSTAGRDIVMRVLESADVVLEGFRPGVMARLGLDYETVAEANPGVIYCSITGYGQSGPRAGAVGHDLNYVADAGGLSLIGDEAGNPVVPINVIADYAAGTYRAIMAILVALDVRRKTGRGQFLDVSLSDGVLSLLNMEIANLLAYGTVPRAGRTRLTGGDACYSIYTTKDGESLTVACNEPKFFRALCAALQLPELAQRQFGDEAEQRRLKERIQAAIATKTLSEWTETLASDEIAVAPVRWLDDVFTDSHYRARNMFVQVPGDGDIVQVGPVIPVSIGAEVPMRSAPAPGQDTRAILSDIGLSADDIRQLFASGVIA